MSKLNFRKFEIFLFILFLLLCVLAWLLSDRSIRNELERLLILEEQQFKDIGLEGIKKSMEQELMRRFSYYSFTGQINDFSSFIKVRYKATRINIISNEKNQSLSERGWTWHNEAEDLFLEGLKCTEDLCLDIKIPWTRTWLIDGSASLVNQLSKISLIGWSALLESSEVKIPKVVSEYVTMADKLEGLKIGGQVFYGSNFGPSKFNLHRLTVVNTQNLEAKKFEHFTGLLWLILCSIAIIYLISYFQKHQLSSTYRILVLILLAILLPSMILGLQSKTLNKEQKKLLRHQREMEVLNSGTLNLVRPSFYKVRHLLPFQNGGIYSIQDGTDLLLFTASSGELKGKQYIDLRRSKTGELISLLLLFCFSILGYIVLFTASNKFWKRLNERLEKQMVNTEAWPMSEDLSEAIVYDHWDVWRLLLDTEKQTQRRALQQRLISFDSEVLLKPDILSNSRSYPKELHCVVVCVAPNNHMSLEEQSARDYFELLNRFLEVFRNNCIKYGGTPFMDAHWHQRALFSFPQRFLSSQRAVLFGLDFIKQIKELGFQSQISFKVIAKEGCLHFTKAGGYKHEVLIKGSVLQECNDAMEFLDNSEGFWAHNELITESLNSSFGFSFDKFDEWCKVTGVKNIEDHLGLLDYSSYELQRTALELLSFKPDENVLNKLLDKLPTLESEVKDQAVGIIYDYLNFDETRSKIFKQITLWADEDYDEIVLKMLIEFKKQPLNLSKQEIDILLKLSKRTHQEAAISLILENTDFENLAELEFRVEPLSNFIKSQLAFIKFKQEPSFECLDQLYDYLQESDEEFLAHILEIWSELKLAEQSHIGTCFKQWFEGKKEDFLIRILDLVESNNITVKLKSLSLISHLQLLDVESQLISIYYRSKDPEFKSEIIFALQNLGSSAYLLQNLN